MFVFKFLFALFLVSTCSGHSWIEIFNGIHSLSGIGTTKHFGRGYHSYNAIKERHYEVAASNAEIIENSPCMCGNLGQQGKCTASNNGDMTNAYPSGYSIPGPFKAGDELSLMWGINGHSSSTDPVLFKIAQNKPGLKQSDFKDFAEFSFTKNQPTKIILPESYEGDVVVQFYWRFSGFIYRTCIDVTMEGNPNPSPSPVPSTIPSNSPAPSPSTGVMIPVINISQVGSSNLKFNWMAVSNASYYYIYVRNVQTNKYLV